MKTKLTVASIVLLLIAVGLYLAFKPHKQDTHYYAAACVVINNMGEPASAEEFKEKLQEVIINENASYAVDKVEFDPLSAQGAIQRYQQLSATDKIQLKKGMDTCLQILMPTEKK